MPFELKTTNANQVLKEYPENLATTCKRKQFETVDDFNWVAFLP